jgi:hypothetical protein
MGMSVIFSRFYFQKTYFLLSLLLLGVEIFIAACVRDSFIRPYGGDYLVVVFLYCLVRSFCNLSVWVTAALVLLFSYLIEALQYFHFADQLGLKESSLARILLGSYSSWADILCYTLGILTVFGMEAVKSNFYGLFRTRAIHRP